MASSFQIGCVFDNYSDLLRALTELESEMGQMFCVRDSERNPHPDLQVQFPRAKIKFECRHSGTKRQKYKLTGARPHQTTVKIGCPVFIYVTLDKDFRQLVVRNNNLEHNHPCGALHREEPAKTVRRRRRRKKDDIKEMKFTSENIEITEIVDHMNDAGFSNDAGIVEFPDNTDVAESIDNRISSLLEIGSVFDDYAHLLRAIADLESQTSQIFCIRYSERNNCPDLQGLFPRAKIKFECRCSGTKRQVYKLTGARPNQTTVKIGCPVFIYVTLDNDSKKLIVRKMNLTHNHAHGLANQKKSQTSKRRVIKPEEDDNGKIKAEEEDEEDVTDNIELACDEQESAIEPTVLSDGHARRLLGKISQYRQSGMFCDTQLLASDGILNAHSVVLAASSPFFCSAMISSSTVPRSESTYSSGQINMMQYNRALLDAVLHVIYTGSSSMHDLNSVRSACTDLGVELVSENERLDVSTSMQNNDEVSSSYSSSTFLQNVEPEMTNSQADCISSIHEQSLNIENNNMPNPSVLVQTPRVKRVRQKSFTSVRKSSRIIEREDTDKMSLNRQISGTVKQISMSVGRNGKHLKSCKTAKRRNNDNSNKSVNSMLRSYVDIRPDNDIECDDFIGDHGLYSDSIRTVNAKRKSRPNDGYTTNNDCGKLLFEGVDDRFDIEASENAMDAGNIHHDYDLDDKSSINMLETSHSLQCTNEDREAVERDENVRKDESLRNEENVEITNQFSEIVQNTLEFENRQSRDDNKIKAFVEDDVSNTFNISDDEVYSDKFSYTDEQTVPVESGQLGPSLSNSGDINSSSYKLNNRPGATAGTCYGKRYTCARCLKVFRFHVQFRRHQNLCDVPFPVFESSKLVDKTIDEKIEFKSISCPACSEKFAYKLQLKRHQEMCGVSHAARDTLNESISVPVSRNSSLEPQRATHECPYCARIFHKHSRMRNHMVTHTDDRPALCTVCGVRFRNERNLRIHKENVHRVDRQNYVKEKKYLCNVCGKRFALSHSYIVHARVHNGERPFKCPVCGIQCKQSCSLQIHMRIHTKDRPYKCDQCPKMFSVHYKLKVHILEAHTEDCDKPFHCPICLKGFASAYRLGHHRRTHTNVQDCS